MSALAVVQNPLAPRTHSEISELDAMRQISQAGSAAAGIWEGVEPIALLALSAKGVIQVEIIPGPPLLPQLENPLRFSSSASADKHGVAIAGIAAEGKHWGELRVTFELSRQTIENPLRFAKYIGQQLGILLIRTDLSVQQKSLRRQAAALKNLLVRRKAIHRARALLQHTHNISEDEAFLLMRRHARQTRKRLFQIADAIVFSDRRKWTQPQEIRLVAPRSRKSRSQT